MLLVATVIWGSAFIAQSKGMDHIGPFTFQAMRCGLGGLVLLPVIYLFDRKENRSFTATWKNKDLWKAGIICGSALFVAAGLQQVALLYTTAGKAGFITTMYIVLVPFLGILLRRKIPFRAWISVLLAVVGLYLLSCVGVTSISIGDLLLLGCALFFAVQITLIDIFGKGMDGLRLNCVQCLVCSFLSGVFMFVLENPSLASIIKSAFPIAYAGMMSMAIAYSLQILGQQRLDPTPASLIMSLEAVFAALCGWLLLNERMSAYEITGCALVFCAVIISQLPEGFPRKNKC